jgi:hypothetical protein
MASTNGLTRRVEALEATLPPTPCRTCAECGRIPVVFTIDIDRSSGRDDDAA